MGDERLVSGLYEGLALTYTGLARRWHGGLFTWSTRETRERVQLRPKGLRGNKTERAHPAEARLSNMHPRRLGIRLSHIDISHMIGHDSAAPEHLGKRCELIGALGTSGMEERCS